MLVLVDLLVENQHQRRQHQNYGGNAQHHALCHDDADIPAQRQAHEAQGQKAGNGGQAAAGEGSERGHNGVCHGVALIHVVPAFLFVAAVEEDGVIHGNAQLQYSCNGFC
ncbi:hypothetical protein SDC9_68606 [bioreactor metagenome]|uniref:Uncharacterized protein n=1 Tax=bioreactor metagenome TaxID=1076179 RepID=A0A644Y0W2_9ZZZZ